MRDALELLLHESSYRRIRDGLVPFGNAVRPLLLHDDGSVTDRGGAIIQPRPTAAWANLDIYRGALPRFTKLCAGAQSLRWLHTASAGLDWPLFGALSARGVRISSSTSTSIGMAEYVLGTLLDHFQQGTRRRATQAAHRWEQIAYREIGRMTWLIVGFGAIGSEVAKRARAFGTRIVGVRRSGAAHPLADEIVTPDRMTERLPDADVVVLALPLTPKSRHMVDADFLAAFRPGAVLVNVARGGHIDEVALLASLDAGRPDFAILDVFACEPLPADSPFWAHPRVALTAHAAPFGDGLVERSDAEFLANLTRFVAGEPLASEATPDEIADAIAAM